MLAGLDVVATPVEPMREGACGAPAAVELISIGRNPQVSLSTPAIVTCDMVVGLDRWLKADLQPSARDLLGSPIVRIEVMSAYSCRNAYGRKKTRMSEHGRANALDIRSFLTERGETADVLTDWGQTERDVKARIAAAAATAKAEAARTESVIREAEKAQAANVAKAHASEPPAGGPQTASPPTSALATTSPRSPAGAAATMANSAANLRGTVTELPGSAADVRVHAPGRRSQAPIGFAPPQQLGGPKVADGTQNTAETRRQKFLHRIHAAACRTFGTTLGPEANDAHRNHFHVDMAERASGTFCE